jgi:hypothetical protein
MMYAGSGCLPGCTPQPGYAPRQIIFGGGPAPDTTAPTVSLTAPSNGATVSGSSVTISATASDNVAVASVQFKVDSTNVGSPITSSPYTTTWNCTGVSDGPHTLYAVANDISGNSARASITVTVNNTPPAISSISSGMPGSTSATITWTTDKAAISQVNYGATAPPKIPIPPIEFITIQLAPHADGRILVSLTATTVDEDEPQLLDQEIAHERINTLDELVALIRAHVRIGRPASLSSQLS